MTDPTQVRRLAHDLRDLANKTLSLRAAIEDYRHDLVRSEHHAPWMSEDEVRAAQRRIHELWSVMDRLETDLRRKVSRSLPFYEEFG